MVAKISLGDRDAGNLLRNFPASRSPSKVFGGVAAIFFTL
jgi:hypothetical protein